VFAWSFWRKQQIQESPAKVRLWISRFPIFSQHPTLAALVNMFGMFLLIGILCFAFPFFLNPVPMRPGMFGNLGLGLGVGLLAAVVIALLMLAGRKLGLRPSGIFAPVLQRLVSVMPGTGAIVEKGYGPLFDQLNLSPDQRARVKGSILDKTMAGVRLGLSLMNQKLDATQRAALVEQMKTETARQEAQLRKFLGDDNFATFQKFERTIPDRMMLNMIFKRPAATAGELNTEQQEQLLEALTKARIQYPWTTELSRRNQPAGDYCSLFTEEILNSFAQEEEQFARQFLPQAQALLNPEQLAKFDKLQTRHRQSQISQYKTALKLFVPKKASD
jgi:hypothetical protein